MGNVIFVNLRKQQANTKLTKSIDVLHICNSILGLGLAGNKNKRNKEAMNRNWDNLKGYPALQTKIGNE